MFHRELYTVLSSLSALKAKNYKDGNAGNCLLIIVMRKRVTELGCERSKCLSTILFFKCYKYKLYNDHCHPFMFC